MPEFIHLYAHISFSSKHYIDYILDIQGAKFDSYLAASSEKSLYSNGESNSFLISSGVLRVLIRLIAICPADI